MAQSQLDVLAVGDVVTDAFIKLLDDEAKVVKTDDGPRLSMPFGTKVPFDHAEVIPAVGNAAWDSSHPDPATSSAPWRIFNIGNSKPVKLTAYVEALESALGRKAIIEMLPLQAGDVPDTFADTSALEQAVGYRPVTTVADGVGRFVDWYRAYFGLT